MPIKVTINCLIALIASCCFNIANAQSENHCTILFRPTFGNAPLNLENSFYKMNTVDSIQFTRCRFYISAIQFLKNGKTVYTELNSIHLVDASENESLQFVLNTSATISFDQIKFNVGIDSTTNVSGALGGDLDPTKGMYWTWQSGYINVKLEGRSNVCNTRNNEFEFHLGGYKNPFSALQNVVLNVQHNKLINIDVDVAKFINSIKLSEQHHIMTPGKQAALLSEKFSKAFSIAQP